MRSFSFIVVVLVFWLSTCSAPEAVIPSPAGDPTQTAFVPTASPLPPVETEAQPPAGKLPAAPFEAEVSVNEEAGFALDYPAGWTVNETVIGPRGTQVLFVSRPELAEAAVIPENEARVTATIYQWDPKNDLAAFVQQQKDAWSASGLTILDEQQLTLELGLPAVQFTIQSPDSQSIFLVTALKDQYLVLAGSGDLELVKEIVGRVRPISN